MPNIAHKRNDLTAHQVETMSGLGMTMPMIEKLTGISTMTLYKYYSPELATGKSKTNLAVAKRVYELATGKDVPPAVQLNAAMFWLKTQAGWREGMDINVTGEINHNSNIQINFVSTNPINAIKSIDAENDQQLSTKRQLPRQEVRQKEPKLWEPTFVGEYHETPSH